MTATAARSQTDYQLFIQGRIESFRQMQELSDTATAKVALCRKYDYFNQNQKEYTEWVDSIVDEKHQWKNRPAL